MRTVKVLSRCHESTAEWEPERLSPLGLKLIYNMYLTGDTPLKASARRAPRKTSKWIRDGYYIPMNWKPGQTAKLNAWRKEMGHSAGNAVLPVEGPSLKIQPMRILIACEYSGRVRDAFIDMGHDAMSCYLLPTDQPGPHHQGDVRNLLSAGWDMMIAHPPCTYLSVSGMHWTKRGLRDPQLTEDALEFVLELMNAPIPRIVVENPVSVISTRVRKPDQVIQPWQFGDDASKKTCLWLKNTPPLNNLDRSLWIPGRIVGEDARGRTIPRWSNQTDSGQNRIGPTDDRWKQRSETYPGIARAMAKQWGELEVMTKAA